MKKLLLSSVALLALTGGAMAADLPSRRMAPIAPAPMVSAVPVFTWTGLYVGVNAGWGWGTDDDDDGLFDLNGGLLDDDDDDGGFVGGGQIGYNMQFGSFVVGVETDLQFADLGGDDRFVVVNGVTHNVGTGGLDYFGTVRARLGFAFDRALVYATGGFAYGGGDNNGCEVGNLIDCDDDDISGGWTLGGGIEFAVTNNLTVKLEGLYVNLDRGGDDTILDTGVLNNGDDLEFGVVRAGVNFKF
ncbi:MAG TPA: outer membrane beta-barrel protein [Microvirga sp.]|nr:outer membrane beta-barrel protein [Microvirga sp.]